MPALEINRSTLVNHGLSVLLAMPDAAFEIGDAAIPVVTDIVDSFKQVVVDDRFTVDRGLVDSIAAFTTPLEVATFFINAKYAELGGATGVLGTTTSAVTATGAGFVRTFQRGAIYWHPQVGAHEVHGPIRLRWQELGAEKGFLGFPSSDVTVGADVRAEGVFAHFQGGSIYWAPLVQTLNPAVTTVTLTGTTAIVAAAAGAIAPVTNGRDLSPLSSVTLAVNTGRPTLLDAAAVSTPLAGSNGVKAGTVADIGLSGGVKALIESSAGAFEVHGAIREKYRALGAEGSILGYPRTDETGTPDGVGRFNHFQGGSIYWTPGTTAHEVHGLIRDRWAGLGWERNPQLGYPITDELIPDPRVGHRRPEVRKKPVLSLPSDVIKLPADAAAAGFPASVVNAPPSAPALTVAAPAVATRPLAVRPTGAGATSVLGQLSDKPLAAAAAAAVTTATVSESALLQPTVVATLDPALILIPITATTPASTPAEQRSQNRFGDFENGVLFWQRGATAASTLAPLAATSDGTSLTFSAADVTTAAMAKLGRAAFEATNVQLASMAFVGTTGYSFDGAQVHNRRHRLQLILVGTESTGFPGIPIPVTATIELQVEVWFDPSLRRISLAATDWMLTQSSTTSYADTVRAALRARLDPTLWTSFEFITLPDTDGGAAIAVLSVKTLQNGAVVVFVEPRSHLVFGSIGELANAVTTSVIHFSPSN